MLDADPLLLGNTLAGLDPVCPARPDGDLHRSAVLGELRFTRMPHGRPSFWQCEQRTSDSRAPFEVICETESDDPPGAAHEACVTAIRRTQLEYARLVFPALEAEMARRGQRLSITWDQLRLRSIRLPYRPLLNPRSEITFLADGLSFCVTCFGGEPKKVRIDSE